MYVNLIDYGLQKVVLDNIDINIPNDYFIYFIENETPNYLSKYGNWHKVMSLSMNYGTYFKSKESALEALQLSINHDFDLGTV